MASLQMFLGRKSEVSQGESVSLNLAFAASVVYCSLVLFKLVSLFPVVVWPLLKSMYS